MVSRVVADTRDDQLGAPTPCGDATVADLLDHIDGLCQAFAAAAEKDTTRADQAPVVDGSRLGPDWRDRIPDRLARLAAAWQAESAWTGLTRAGGIDMTGEVAASVATNEYTAAPELVEAAAAFVAPSASQNPDGVPGLFGPPVAVPDDASPLDRLIGLTGRDPAWRPG
jgi:hypothetical protein